MERPSYGEERLMLIPPARKGGKHVLRREVWTEAGWTTYWDEAAKDWGSWRGSWQPLETLGRFDTREEARQFVIARGDVALSDERR